MATLLLSAALMPAFAADAAKPYKTDADSRKDIADAQARAKASHKMVMVIFGANWCGDCIVLHRSLDAPNVRDYVRDHFEVVSVDVDQFNKNVDVAKSVGVTLDKGIPVAAFVASDGSPIANTNSGELEPARNYSPEQVLQFLREVVDHHKVVKPQINR